MCRLCEKKEVYTKKSGLCRSCYREDWFRQFDGFYLYMIRDLEHNIKWVGVTTNYKRRLYNHICGNVIPTRQFISKDKYNIEYLNLNKVVVEEIELYALENELILLYETELNAKNKDGSYRLTDVTTIDELRMFSLISTIHSFDSQWIKYRTKKVSKKLVYQKKAKKICLCKNS
jgi:hypothetical protein